jgi:hypothetical protein
MLFYLQLVKLKVLKHDIVLELHSFWDGGSTTLVLDFKSFNIAFILKALLFSTVHDLLPYHIFICIVVGWSFEVIVYQLFYTSNWLILIPVFQGVIYMNVLEDE